MILKIRWKDKGSNADVLKRIRTMNLQGNTTTKTGAGDVLYKRKWR